MRRSRSPRCVTWATASTYDMTRRALASIVGVAVVALALFGIPLAGRGAESNTEGRAPGARTRRNAAVGTHLTCQCLPCARCRLRTRRARDACRSLRRRGAARRRHWPRPSRFRPHFRVARRHGAPARRVVRSSGANRLRRSRHWRDARRRSARRRQSPGVESLVVPRPPGTRGARDHCCPRLLAVTSSHATIDPTRRRVDSGWATATSRFATKRAASQRSMPLGTRST